MDTSADLCVRCNERPGPIYGFKYGRKIGEQAVVGGTEHTYRIGGMHHHPLCDVCVRRRRLATAIPLGIGTVVLAALTLLAYLNPDAGPGEPDKELFWIALVATALFLFYFLFSALGRRKHWGEVLAMDRELPSMQAQGWDTLWYTDGSHRLIKWVLPWAR